MQTVKIDSLAAMKRAIRLPNISIRVLEHWQPQLVGTMRKCAKAQTNGYSFEGPRLQDQKIVEMWCFYPKVSELRFHDDGSVTFYPDMLKSWRLIFELEAEPCLTS